MFLVVSAIDCLEKTHLQMTSYVLWDIKPYSLTAVLCFAVCREDLAKPAQTLFLHNLTGILETAIRATNAQFDDADILKRLDVRLLEVCHCSVFDLACLYLLHTYAGK